MQIEYITAREAGEMLGVEAKSLTTYHKKWGVSRRKSAAGLWEYSLQALRDYIARRDNNPRYKAYFCRDRHNFCPTPRISKQIIPAAEWERNPDTEIAQAIAEAHEDEENPLTLFLGAVHIRNIIGTPAEVEYLTPTTKPNTANGNQQRDT